jgi:hypothetical protein
MVAVRRDGGAYAHAGGGSAADDEGLTKRGRGVEWSGVPRLWLLGWEMRPMCCCWLRGSD